MFWSLDNCQSPALGSNQWPSVCYSLLQGHRGHYGSGHILPQEDITSCTVPACLTFYTMSVVSFYPPTKHYTSPAVHLHAINCLEGNDIFAKVLFSLSTAWLLWHMTHQGKGHMARERGTRPGKGTHVCWSFRRYRNAFEVNVDDTLVYIFPNS